MEAVAAAALATAEVVAEAVRAPLPTIDSMPEGSELRESCVPFRFVSHLRVTRICFVIVIEETLSLSCLVCVLYKKQKQGMPTLFVFFLSSSMDSTLAHQSFSS